ncbi:hypothetical protein [Acidovorax sp. sic0104]|uniref:hypothetical protein n=1 Tax=Acidovorax sp. sic0104 TaxID=2854784 RepID=UPI001C484FA4|nr:hypothetical protein [Acidovorax sp. sic0104]MBV7542054.1 hypothetical protein [Acidovorax sp. sic0104]
MSREIAAVEPGGENIERLARFQSLQAGQYWRSNRAIPEEGIARDAVLLIISIRLADDAPHTIVLRPHPSDYRRGRTLEWVDGEGNKQRGYHRFLEHRFLLKDFLDCFAYEPDHEAVREREIAQINTTIMELQGLIAETQANPALMNAVVDQGLRDAQAAAAAGTPGHSKPAQTDAGQPNGGSSEDLRASEAGDRMLPAPLQPVDPQIVTMATGTLANAIESGLTESKVHAMREAAGHELKVATIKAQWIQSKSAAIAEELSKLAPYFEERGAQALAGTEEVRAYVQGIVDGIASLDLYLGTNVEVHTVCKGRCAPADVPLTVVQAKRVVEHELAVYTDIDEWFDFEDQNRFFEALRSEPDLVEQFFPTQRCVLVAVTTARHINYGDAFVNMIRNRENSKVYLMVRDGENIHCVLSPVESHLAAERLFPTTDEAANVFRGIDGTKIRFEDVAFTDKLRAFELQAQHYKRFLILAAGLDHRLKLFGHFHDEGETLGFVSQRFQDKWLRFLHDDDGRMMVAGGAKSPLLKDWIAEQNSYLRPGSRVLCHWEGLINPRTAPGIAKNSYSDVGKGFNVRATAIEPMECKVAYKKGADVCVDVRVRANSMRSDREFTSAVRVSAFSNGYYHYVQLPFLVLDAVDPQELHWFIHHRNTRSTSHLEYLRFFKRALKLVLAEREAELPSRRALRAALDSGGIGQPEERDGLVQRAVTAWRAAHRGQDLPTPEAASAPEWSRLLDQMFALAGDGVAQAAQAGEFIRGMGLEPLRLVLSGKAKPVIYATPLAKERDDRLEPHAWVHRITLGRTKSALFEVSRRWALLPVKSAAETVVQEWEGVKDWPTASTFLSYERKREILGRIERWEANVGRYLDAPNETQAVEMVEELADAFHASTKLRGDRVPAPALAFPIAVFRRGKAGPLTYLCLAHREPSRLIARLVENSAAQAMQDVGRRVRRAVGSTGWAARLWDTTAQQQGGWTLAEIGVDALKGPAGGYVKADQLKHLEDASYRPISHLMSDWFRPWLQNYGPRITAWAPTALLESEGAAIDAVMGFKQAENYAPHQAMHIRFTKPKGRESPQDSRYLEWYDLAPAGFEFPKHAVDMFGTNFGMSTWGQTHLNREEALQYIARTTKNATLAGACDLPDAPQPPQGVERVFVLRG